MVAGRPFNALDAGASNSPVIVDNAFAQRFFDGTSAVGRRIRYAASGPNAKPSAWFEIVGVAENRQRNPIDPSVVRPTVLYPVAPEQLAGTGLSVRLRESAALRNDDGIARTVHQIITAVDPTLRIGEIRIGADAESQDALAIRLVGLVLSLILLTVLLFSAAGVYSLMSFAVAQRRREIGIRTALGAPPLSVLRSVFARVALQVAAGVVFGMIGATAIAPAVGDVVLAGGDGDTGDRADHGAGGPCRRLRPRAPQPADSADRSAARRVNGLASEKNALAFLAGR